MTAQDLHQRTGVPMNTLGTYLWELKRDGYIRRVGGRRGAYRYGITNKGKDRIGEGEDPLRQLAMAVGSSSSEGSKAFADFGETLKIIDQLDDYRLLKAYSQWLAGEHADMFTDGADLPERLHDLTLEFLGIDPTTYRRQSSALIGLLDFMKETP